ncbi:hypothetical protein [Burkholderia glumae]|nr:hypothetical protein [Burkholderia glumae]
MTRSEQATARRALRERGLFEEQRVGMPARVLTRVDFDALGALIQAHSENREALHAPASAAGASSENSHANGV